MDKRKSSSQTPNRIYTDCVSSQIIKRIDHKNKVFKVVAFHRHRNSEVFDFASEEEANSFYDQLRVENAPTTKNESRFMKSFPKN